MAQKLLIVEDAVSLREALASALRGRFARVETAASASAAQSLLQVFRPELMLVDVELGDGNAIDVIRAAVARPPIPVFVAMSGVARPEDAFELAQLGVRCYLPKPVTLSQVESALDAALSSGPNVVPHVQAAVGRVPLRQLEELVRDTMLSEALAKSGGSRRGAARLLDVSRQLLQHMLRGRHAPLSH